MLQGLIAIQDLIGLGEHRTGHRLLKTYAEHLTASVLVTACDINFVLLSFDDLACLHHLRIEYKKRAASELDQMLYFLEGNSN